MFPIDLGEFATYQQTYTLGQDDSSLAVPLTITPPTSVLMGELALEAHGNLVLLGWAFTLANSSTLPYPIVTAGLYSYARSIPAPVSNVVNETFCQLTELQPTVRSSPTFQPYWNYTPIPCVGGFFPYIQYTPVASQSKFSSPASPFTVMVSATFAALPSDDSIRASYPASRTLIAGVGRSY